MKTLLVFGASGRTGKLIIDYALQKGYKIKALVRDPSKLILKSEHLTVLKGTPTNKDDVMNAMQDCDAVISAMSALSEKESISFKKISPPHTLKKTIENSIYAMNTYGVKRIVTLSSIGAGDSFKYAPWYMKLFIKISNFKIVFADHHAQEQLLMHSNLDWVIARPVALTNDEKIKKLVISFNKTPKPFKISRKQLAKFMVDAVENNEFLKRSPLLSEK